MTSADIFVAPIPQGVDIWDFYFDLPMEIEDESSDQNLLQWVKLADDAILRLGGTKKILGEEYDSVGDLLEGNTCYIDLGDLDTENEIGGQGIQGIIDTLGCLALSCGLFYIEPVRDLAYLPGGKIVEFERGEPL